jgi:hypothetical protein
MLGKSYNLTIGVVSFFFGEKFREIQPLASLAQEHSFDWMPEFWDRVLTLPVPQACRTMALRREKKKGDFTVRIAWFMMEKLIIFRKTMQNIAGVL